MRTRLVHPEICADNVVGALDPWAQVLYHRLPLLADRAGRFRYCPPLIWATVIPWYKGDTAALLETIAAAGLIRRYEVNGVQFADLPRFLEDQHPHPREAASQIPAYDSAGNERQHLGVAWATPWRCRAAFFTGCFCFYF